MYFSVPYEMGEETKLRGGGEESGFRCDLILKRWCGCEQELATTNLVFGVRFHLNPCSIFLPFDFPSSDLASVTLIAEKHESHFNTNHVNWKMCYMPYILLHVQYDQKNWLYSRWTQQSSKHGMKQGVETASVKAHPRFLKDADSNDDQLTSTQPYKVCKLWLAQ